MWFFLKTYNTSHYQAMSRVNNDAYLDGFFAVAYGDKKAFYRADFSGIVFW